MVKKLEIVSLKTFFSTVTPVDRPAIAAMCTDDCKSLLKDTRFELRFNFKVHEFYLAG